MSAVLTIDIGGTKCAVAITDDSGVHGYKSWPTNGSIENLDSVIDFYSAHLRAGGQPVQGIGVSFGGPVDHAAACVKRSVHVSGWSGFDFANWSRGTLGLPIAVDNDAKIGALAEARVGGHSTDNLMYVTVSTGIGAGVVSDGRLLRGATNEAGELGHTRVSDEPKVCSCGRTGCLERICSGYWLEQDHGRSAQELLADDAFLDAYCVRLARGLATGVLAYNPGVIVLGGGVAKTGSRLVNSLAIKLELELGSWNHLMPSIKISNFGYEGVHLGARELLNDLLR